MPKTVKIDFEPRCQAGMKEFLGSQEYLGFQNISWDWSVLKCSLIIHWKHAGIAISGHLEGLKSQKFLGSFPRPPLGRAYGAPKPSSCCSPSLWSLESLRQLSWDWRMQYIYPCQDNKTTYSQNFDVCNKNSIRSYYENIFHAKYIRNSLRYAPWKSPIFVFPCQCEVMWQLCRATRAMKILLKVSQ